MALAVDCCLVISFFGVIFYISIGFLIIGQPNFLRFKPENQNSSVISSFIVSAVRIKSDSDIHIVYRWDDPTQEKRAIPQFTKRELRTHERIKTTLLGNKGYPHDGVQKAPRRVMLDHILHYIQRPWKMGVLPCKCLRDSAVYTIEVIGPPQATPGTIPSLTLLAKTDAQFNTNQPDPKLLKTVETVGVFEWEDTDDEEKEDEISFYKRLNTNQSFLQVDTIPGNDIGSGELVSRQEVIMKINDGVVRILQRELPDSPLLEDHEGRWIQRKSGVYVFEYMYTVRPDILLNEQQSKIKISKKPWHTQTYCLPDGRVYYGQIQKNKPHGVGILITAHPQSLYKGDFSQGIPHGVGVFQTQMLTAEGYWNKGWFMKGFVKYIDEGEYTGTFKQGRPEGVGHFKDLINNVSYNGTFKQGFYEGQGIYVCSGYTYRGGFQKGKKNGLGSIEYIPTKTQPAKTLRGVWSKDTIPRPN